MGYAEFLDAFAERQGLESTHSLLAENADRYAFQINSRDRARQMIGTLGEQIGMTNFAGKKVLDVGCAYGSYAIELARLGADVVGIELVQKWLDLAEANASGDAEVTFLQADASSIEGRLRLEEHGPFDLIVLNDVLEHIFDTVGLFDNLRSLSHDETIVYFKVPNGLCTKHVLQEGHKRKFGISLLAPDYWSHYVSAPFHIYYRRWPYFPALFSAFGFTQMRILHHRKQGTLAATREKIEGDLEDIIEKGANYDGSGRHARRFLRDAIARYEIEVRTDLQTLSHEELYEKYLVTFWTGVAARSSATLPRPSVRARLRHRAWLLKAGALEMGKRLRSGKDGRGHLR